MLIDLRSDTVTRPSAGMLVAMQHAKLGDDVIGDDPTVKVLERRCAEMFELEQACFVPSGTMANQLAIRTQTEHGDEIIAHEDSHVIHYETGGPAAISGCMIRPLRGERGLFRSADVREAVRMIDEHEPVSRLLVLENTQNRGGGTIWPLALYREVLHTARNCNLKVHLDGARLMNAAVALGVDPAEYTRSVDTVSMCFSKGLGAPVGSILAGSSEIIHRARRFRKMLGGAMRQSGLLAAAAIYALEHNVDRLEIDHANAKRLAYGIARLPYLAINPSAVETNMVFFHVDHALASADSFCQRLADHGLLCFSMGRDRVRMVTHLDVSEEMIDEAIRVTERTVDQIRSTVLEGSIA